MNVRLEYQAEQKILMRGERMRVECA